MTPQEKNPVPGTPSRPTRRRGIFLKFALLAVSVTISILLGEVILRVTQQDGNCHHRLFCEYHPLLGWQKKPDFTGLHTGPNRVYEVLESMNSKGIRGPEYPLDKPEREFRILVLGDSFAEGYTVAFEDLFSEVLKANLGQLSQDPIQVINSGTGGYSTDQELLWYTSEGYKYGADLTVLMFCNNDMLFNNTDRYWHSFKPMFQLKDGELELTGVPVPPPPSAADEEGEMQTGGHAGSRWGSVKQFLNKYSYIYRNLRVVLLQNESTRSFFIKIDAAADDDEMSQPEYHRLSDWRKASTEELRSAWEITEALLVKLHEETQASGSELVVFADPLYPEVARTCISTCRSNEIRVIDPLIPYQAESRRLRREGKQLTFDPFDIHWNEEGNRVVAEILEEYIVEHYPRLRAR